MGEREKPSIIFGYQSAYSSRFEVYIQPVHSAMSQCGSEKQRMAANMMRHSQEKDLSRVNIRGQHFPVFSCYEQLLIFAVTGCYPYHMNRCSKVLRDYIAQKPGLSTLTHVFLS